MELKFDGDGHVVHQEVGGKEMPIYTDGKKSEPFDRDSAVEKIKTQAEDLADVEKSSTKEVADAKKALRAWERLGDIKGVRAAVQTVAVLSKDDIDATDLPNQLANLTAERDALQDQLDDATHKITDLDGENYELTVGNEIATGLGSLELIDGFTAREARALYGDRFKREDGRVVAYADGKPVIVVEDGNKTRPATVAEALDQFIPQTFRKPSGSRGSDAVTDLPASQTSVRSKADLRDPVKKAEFITNEGLDAFQRLPLRSVS